MSSRDRRPAHHADPGLSHREWPAICDPMQVPLDGEPGWAVIEQVDFNP